MVEWLEAYTIVEIGEIRIGIIGIIGDVESSILSSNVADYDFVDARNIVKSLAGELRGEKDCDVVIVAEHGDDDSLNYTLATYEGDHRIDGIFTGHTHSPTDREINRADGESICVLQNGGYGQSFATLTLEFDENGVLTDTDGMLNYTDNFTADGILSSVFEKYAEEMAIGDTVLITVDEDMSRYDVGINVAYSMYAKYDVDLAVINSGGVRTSIDAGEVTYAEVFQILPFENEVYIVTLSGEMLRSYLNNAGGIYYWGIYSEYIVDTEYYDIAIVDYVYLGSYFENYRNDTCIDTNDLIRDVFIELILGSV
jgi:2',3'-cyclic-nucleotide 2'-phosphodiesterase (5'-nucleotidase family)